MEKVIEAWQEEKRCESLNSPFLSSYLQTNRDSLQRLQHELREKNLSSSEIAKVLGLPQNITEKD